MRFDQPWTSEAKENVINRGLQTTAILSSKIEIVNLSIKFEKYIIPFCRYHPYIVSLI